MIRKKWWQKKSAEGSHQWCVIKVEEYIRRIDEWEGYTKDVYKSCHITNLPRGSYLLNKNLTQHEAQGLCKLLNQGESP